ncbi:MAG TPA: CHAD domain-containing protein [Clostridia bacterium]|nr:CHAD domain-containing protein [Clostridia bacterium]
MDIVLVRHAAAEEPRLLQPDRERRLTEAGIRDFDALMPALKKRMEQAGRVQIWSSPASRARQTADIIRQALSVPGISEHGWIYDGGERSLDSALDDLMGADTLFIVGHQPWLSVWAHGLTGEDIPFKKGAIVCLLHEPESGRPARLLWRLRPGLPSATAGAGPSTMDGNLSPARLSDAEKGMASAAGTGNSPDSAPESDSAAHAGEAEPSIKANLTENTGHPKSQQKSRKSKNAGKTKQRKAADSGLDGKPNKPGPDDKAGKPGPDDKPGKPAPDKPRNGHRDGPDDDPQNAEAALSAREIADEVNAWRRRFTKHPDRPRNAHQLRVSLRRARSFLSFLRPLLPAAEYAPHQDALREGARALAVLRETDVLLKQVKELERKGKRRYPLLAGTLALRRERAAQLAHLQLQTPEHTRALDSALAYIAGLDMQALSGPDNLRVLDTRLTRWHRRAVAELAAVNFEDIARAHELRLRFKKLANTNDILEATGLLPPRPIKGIKRLQRDLGKLCDLDAHARMLRALAVPGGNRQLREETREALSVMHDLAERLRERLNRKR